MNDMIVFDKVSFSYGDNHVIKEFNLTVKEGESICLFGPSGCGKSTLVRMICGLEKPKGGTLTVNAKTIRPVFQQDRLLPFKSVRENIEMFANGSDIEPVIEALGLKRSEDKYPRNLSGGTSRRTSIARALADTGDLYIFDEPFNGLDDENVEKAMELIDERTRGKTVVFVLHSRQTAQKLGCRIIELTR